MKAMALWVIVMLLGVAALTAYPFLKGDPIETAQVAGVWPGWLIPVGYGLIFVGGRASTTSNPSMSTFPATSWS